MAILTIRDPNSGKLIEIPAIKGSKGDSGVYVGSGDMPEGYNVQVDPTGTIPTLVKSVNNILPDENGNISISIGTDIEYNINSILSTEINESGELVINYTNGTSETVGVVVGKDGVGIEGFDLDSEGNLSVRFTDSTITHLGNIAGRDGTNGNDGFSPTVAVTDTSGGHTVTITDVNGEQSFDVLDGTAGTITEEDISNIAAEAAKLVTIDQVRPEQVVFPEGAYTTYQVGNVELINGMGTLVQPGGTLADFFKIFIQELMPEIVEPSVTITMPEANAYEVGTYVTPTYTAVLNPGSYSFGPDTGIIATSWTITSTSDDSSTEPSGSFQERQVIDNMTYRITAKAAYGAGAIPKTNTGNEYVDGQIQAGEKSEKSAAITGYRNTFYGTLESKDDLTSDVIRGLAGKSGKELKDNNSFTINIPVNAMRVVFAYPATLPDVSIVTDENGMNADITSSFSMAELNVAGANEYTPISYKVYTLDFANPNDKANKFKVTI